MQRRIRYWGICFAILCGTSTAHAQLFEADSKRYGNPKMDIVMTEVERRPNSSVIDIKITSIGSSVGSSFFLLCSIRQLAQLRGNYRYIVKLEGTPKLGQMLIGLLRSSSEKLSDLGPEFANVDALKAVIDLDQFAEICAFTK
ncbi:hypothetical protein [Undibacterium sp. Ren11W]|uniref:hypothetical protein n=1 Tax=Undibacterium sp. Ren11W TaxID=3413045 RepID=UPI003BF3B128